jgi:hypothetical protein
MRPLVFLFVRSFVNGVKRSLTSPRRTIGLILFSLYYFGLIMRPFEPDEPLNFTYQPLPLSLPSRYVLDGVIFAGFGVVSLMMMSGVLTYRGGFRPADVDVLFATPIPPRVVLGFRVLRDYLFALVFPLFFGLLGFRVTRAGWQSLINNYPAHGADMIRMGWIAWMLMALGWVSVGYGASLFVGRSDLRSDRNRLIITYSIVTVVSAVLLYSAARLATEFSWRSALEIAHSWPLRIALLPASAAAAVAVGGIEGDWATLAFGGLGSVAIILAGYSAALSQVDWLYDQGAARGFDSIRLRNLGRSGNQYALLGEYARKGKLRRKWLADRISRHTLRGGGALVWKEMVIQTRGLLSQGMIVGLLMVAATGALAWVSRRSPEVAPVGVVSMLFCCAYLFNFTLGLVGFQEMLRRVDLLKPLPFTASRTIWWEVLGKTPIPATFIVIGAAVATIIVPQLGSAVLGGVLVALPLFVEISGAILLTVVLFPDFDDPTQRGLSGAFMMLAIIICSAPGLAVFFALSQGGHVPMLVAAVPSAALLLVISFALATVAGQIYAGYNPSE